MRQVESEARESIDRGARQQHILEDRLKQLAEGEDGRQQRLVEAHNRMLNALDERFQSQQTQLTGGLHDLLQEHRTAMAGLLSQWDIIRSEYEDMVRASRASSEAVHDASENLKASASQLGALSSSLEKASAGLSDTLSDLNAVQQRTAEQQSTSMELLNAAVKALQELQEKISQTTQAMEIAAKYADNAFTSMGGHVEAFTREMEQNLTAAQNQIARLLREYADQVQSQTSSRMNAWNLHTNEFTSQMVEVTRALSAAVDDLESRARGNA